MASGDRGKRSGGGASARAGRDLRAVMEARVGFTPTDAVGWLYVGRGLYRGKEYDLVPQAVAHCLRSEATVKEAQHLLAFSYMHLGRSKLAAAAFLQSIKVGNATDWQPLVELALDDPASVAKS